MDRPVKLLKDEKFRLEQILDLPQNVLEEFSNPELVSWDSFQKKKKELEKELNDVNDALQLIKPNID